MKKVSIVIFSIFISTSICFGQKIGVLMDSYVMERWMNDRIYMCEKIEQLGGECLVEVANGNAQEQLKQAMSLIEAGVKVLIVVPVDIQKAIEIVNYAEKKGVKIIAYDRIIPSLKTDLYLSFDNEMVGKLQAEEAYKHAGSGNYILINGPKSDYNAILFRKGQLKVLNPLIEKGEVTILEDIVLTNWGELDAFLAMQELNMTLDKKINAIVAANDALANGVISAIGDESEVKPIYITGQDAEIQAIRNIKKDLQDMTIYKPIKKLAYLAAESAMQLAKSENVPKVIKTKVAGVNVNSILLKPMVVTAENYMTTVISDGHVTIDELVSKE